MLLTIRFGQFRGGCGTAVRQIMEVSGRRGRLLHPQSPAAAWAGPDIGHRRPTVQTAFCCPRPSTNCTLHNESEPQNMFFFRSGVCDERYHFANRFLVTHFPSPYDSKLNPIKFHARSRVKKGTIPANPKRDIHIPTLNFGGKGSKVNFKTLFEMVPFFTHTGRRKLKKQGSVF